jgi:hypothetical protein
MMKKVLLVVAVVLMMCVNSFAADPIPISRLYVSVSQQNYYSTSATSPSRTNLFLHYRDANDEGIHQPERFVKVWMKFQNNPVCGDMNTTATLTLHNGQTAVMKKNLDYNFLLPVMNQDLAIEFNRRIYVTDILTSCIQVQAFDNTTDAVPTDYQILSP